LERKTIDGKGLVTVLLPAANIIKRIPLIGSILSGSMVGIPVEVSGPLERPRVSYLSPAALGAELVNIPLRILKAPLDALQIFTPFCRTEQKMAPDQQVIAIAAMGNYFGYFALLIQPR
jgi:hypothetical protein